MTECQGLHEERGLLVRCVRAREADSQDRGSQVG